MFKELKKHKAAYTILFLGLAVFLAVFLGVWPNRDVQRLAIIGVTVFYFIWGVLTHVNTTTFTKRVAFEYGTVSLLGGIFLLILTM